IFDLFLGALGVLCGKLAHKSLRFFRLVLGKVLRLRSEPALSLSKGRLRSHAERASTGCSANKIIWIWVLTVKNFRVDSWVSVEEGENRGQKLVCLLWRQI
ncbi:MAG: hypothetical protein AAB403_05790, partial [Planctomycetota bacterium]